ncbi:MAG: hypothetical protein HQL01_14320 [Nitrospirae bacterium]|nr:hypothetical protein [Nitrospirota bacterium]
MSENNIKKERGIFAIIDIVDFTPQHNRLGDVKAQKFTSKFYAEITEKIKPFNFELIKTALDAVFIFGQDPEDFLKFIIDLYTDNPIKGSEGFDLKLRTVANTGMFTFVVDSKGKRTDIVSKEATIAFRIEKKARTWEVLVTENLFTEVQDYLEDLEYTHIQEPYKEALKGFEIRGNTLVLHQLTPPWKEEGSDLYYPDYYRAKRADLYGRTKNIPIFGNLYQPLDMEKSFIRLTLEKDFNMDDVHDNQTKVKQAQQKHIRFDARTEIEERGRDKDNADKISATQLLEYNKGFILGTPGAGKTTILHHIVFETLKANIETNILFVNCRV